MTFYLEREIKALRKPRQCGSCGRAMDVGEAALYCSGKHEDVFWTGHYHHECRAAEIVLNRQFGTDLEWYDLSDFDMQDRDFIRETHPLAYARIQRGTK